MKLVTTRKRKQIKPRSLAPISPNQELHQLSELFTRITPSSKLITRIAKRLKAPRTNRHPVKVNHLKPDVLNIVVAKVLDDDRAVVLPKLNVACLQISINAKEKIERYGGKVYKLDEIFKLDLEKAELLIGDVTKRSVYKHFGMGEPGSKATEKVITKQKNVMKRPN